MTWYMTRTQEGGGTVGEKKGNAGGETQSHV